MADPVTWRWWTRAYDPRGALLWENPHDDEASVAAALQRYQQRMVWGDVIRVEVGDRQTPEAVLVYRLPSQFPSWR